MEKRHIAEIDLDYTLKRYRRQKRINMHVRDDELLVTAAPRVSIREIEQALIHNRVWLKENTAHHALQRTLTIDPKVVANLKKVLLPKINEKIKLYNSHYNYSFKRVTIRNQKSRWGSCSSNGALSFNVHLLVLPEILQDYVVVHELCHLKEMNHSPRFWSLVQECIPEYKKCRRALRARRIGVAVTHQSL